MSHELEAAAQSPQSSATAQVTAAKCGIESLIDGLSIHKDPDSTSPILGKISRGDLFPADCQYTVGGIYYDCGALPNGDNRWIKVYHPGVTHGYVAFLCVRQIFIPA